VVVKVVLLALVVLVVLVAKPPLLMTFLYLLVKLTQFM
jgi:hypothetical protein